MKSETGANIYNTTLFIGWDEPGGTYDHVAPGDVPPPDPNAGPGQCDFAFDRSGYRVPAVIVSPWVESGSVYNDEHRHTSMIATLRKLGKTIVLAEQNLHFCLGLADRAVVIDKGTDVFCGTIHELNDNADIKQRYLSV